MFKRLFITLLLIAATGLATLTAQQRSTPVSQQFRLAEGIVRIAETDQLADSVNVWGDINNPGRYLVPRGTKVHELISYARGPAAYRTGETTIDWSKLRLEITISKYNVNTGMETAQFYTFRYSDPFPEGLRNYTLTNDEIVSLELKRRPSFIDYVRVIAPVVSTVATTLLIIDRL
jgi:hypothetical protein